MSTPSFWERMTDKAEKIKCDEELCVEEFPTVSAAIQHKFRKHRQSNVKHYCPYCGMQFPIKVLNLFPIYVQWVYNFCCSIVETNTFFPMKMKEEAVECINVQSVKLHSTMILLFSIMQSQFIIGIAITLFFFYWTNLFLYNYLLGLSNSSKLLRHHLPVVKSSAIMPRNLKVCITAIYVDLSTLWNTI